jgi:formylglycine-generating enzyme
LKTIPAPLRARRLRGLAPAALGALVCALGAAADLDGHAVAGDARTVGCRAADGDVLIPAGVVLLGEDGAENPGAPLDVPAFRIDRHEVTNRQFARFVEATGYRTAAERQGEGAVFVAPDTVASEDPAQWWRLVRGATWRHPQGPGSSILARMDHPVVQVTYADAAAYARWAGRGLPSEAQWERAARGEQTAPVSPGRWAYEADGAPKANTWQGVFPVVNTKTDGYGGLAPVGCFTPNAFGLEDMIGNAWEWTSEVHAGPAQRVVKGGSFLCSFDYCANFRPAGWQAQEADLPTSHIGFRTVAPA